MTFYTITPPSGSRGAGGPFGPHHQVNGSPSYDDGYVDGLYGNDYNESYIGDSDYGNGYNDGTDDRPASPSGPSAAGDGWAAYDDPDAEPADGDD